MLPEEEFNPATGETKRVDQGLKRWMRGYKKKFLRVCTCYMTSLSQPQQIELIEETPRSWLLTQKQNTFDVLYFLGSLSAAGLGIYSSILVMEAVFGVGAITSFTCANPAGGG